MEHVKTYFNNLISNSTLITISIVSFFGYFFAYQYELGSAIYYNIPEYLVQLEPLQVVFNAVVIYFILFALGFLIYVIVSNPPSFLRRKPNLVTRTKSDIITSRFMAILIVFLLLLIFPILLGQNFARDKSSYIIFRNNHKDYIIVKIYGNTMIALAFNKKHRILKNDILLLPKSHPVNGTVRSFVNLKVEK